MMKLKKTNIKHHDLVIHDNNLKIYKSFDMSPLVITYISNACQPTELNALHPFIQ